MALVKKEVSDGNSLEIDEPLIDNVLNLRHVKCVFLFAEFSLAKNVPLPTKMF